MRNFAAINTDLDTHADQIYRMEKAMLALIMSNEKHLQATRLNTEQNNNNQ